jgi:hypothetical protein
MRDTTKWLVAAVAAVGAVVVAGLQLKNVPHGTLATTVALLGVVAALGAIAYILYRAAVILVAGYTTFGGIVDLDADRGYLHQQEKAEEWDNRLRPYRAMKRRPETPPNKRRDKARQAIRRSYATVVIQIMKVARRLTLRHAKDEDIRIDELIHYLNRDTFFFTQGLAANITQLYAALEETDKEILSLRGEKIGEEEEEEEVGGKEEEGGDADVGELQEVTPPNPTISGPAPDQGPRTEGLVQADDSDDGQALLRKADWRRERLESAMGVIIAFANQKLLEQRFQKLIHAIVIGGGVVALGAGAFAVAPKWEEPQPLSITQPTQVTVRVVGNGLGSLCPPDTLLKGVAVGGTWDKPIVVTEKAGTCPAQQVTLDHGQAIAEPVLVPSPSASATPSSSK